MIIGFVGFGEAAAAIAEGLHEEGAENLICFDAMQNDPRFTEKLEAKRAKAHARRKEASADVCREADIVISAVPSGFALSAAKEAVPGLTRSMWTCPPPPPPRRSASAPWWRKRAAHLWTAP